VVREVDSLLGSETIHCIHEIMEKLLLYNLYCVCALLDSQRAASKFSSKFLPRCDTAYAYVISDAILRFSISTDDILLFWTGSIPGRQPPIGLFETFSDTAASSLAELDKYTDIGICFEDAIVGVTKNALLGEDVWFDPNYCPPPPEGADMEVYRDMMPNKGSANRMNWRKYVYVGTGTQEQAAKRDSSPIECDPHYREATSSEALREFREYMIHIHGLTDDTPTALDDDSANMKIRLLSRSRRRLIINEEDLIQGLQELIPHSEVSITKFDSLSFHEQLQVTRRSHVLVGMHGAGFANALWLSAKSSIIELFPYRYYKPTCVNKFPRLCEF
jgi:hypothetical protein